ncbi:MAG: HAD hydrolase-like protein, partial [Motiliproteus sp.]
MFKFLIFDWDGTLIDSADRIIASMQRAAVDLGLVEPGAEAVRNIIGLGLPEALQAIFPGIDKQGVEGMRERYSHYYLRADDTPTALFPGVEQGLAQLAEKGYQLAVATGKSRRGLEQVFAETGIKELFQHS